MFSFDERFEIKLKGLYVEIKKYIGLKFTIVYKIVEDIDGEYNEFILEKETAHDYFYTLLKEINERIEDK